MDETENRVDFQGRRCFGVGTAGGDQVSPLVEISLQRDERATHSRRHSRLHDAGEFVSFRDERSRTVDVRPRPSAQSNALQNDPSLRHARHDSDDLRLASSADDAAAVNGDHHGEYLNHE